MQVKCEYCGAWINDTDEKCPNCDAANTKLVRTAKTTPTTIEELQDWYKARKLPPYEKTRFFIGRNYMAPKAFGIYKEGNNFIVYKNKADGNRVIRYKGTDEAYAVNEIYLRLKEEILNQKMTNSTGQSGTRSLDGIKGIVSGVTGCLGRCSGCLFNIAVKIGLIMGLITAAALVIIILAAIISPIFEDKSPQPGLYYVSEDKSDIYYHYNKLEDGRYEWWQTPVENPSWEQRYCSSDNDGFPDNLTSSNLCGIYGAYSEMINEAGLSEDNITNEKSSLYNISNWHPYTDLHHTSPNSSAYYYIDGKSYYYLNDSHGASYGTADNSGWYTYDDGWEYYCSGSDREALGDELWYDDDEYLVGSDYSHYEAYISGNVYNFSDIEAAAWSTAAMATTFEDTTWYGQKVAADEAYDEYISSKSSSSYDWSSSSDWSSDSDWDWDSGSDSWDSGSTDWDSDW